MQIAICLSIQNLKSKIQNVLLSAKRFDLDIDACREIELHERVHGLRSRVEDVHQTLVRSDLKLLARFLIDVRRAQHRPLVLQSGKRDGPGDARARSLCRLDDLRGGLIQHAMIVSLESDSDLFVQHNFLNSKWYGRGLFDDVGDSACSHCPPTFSNREP